jgi:lipoate-protein ligase A
MAVDEAFPFLCSASEPSDPRASAYGFDPPTVSFGTADPGGRGRCRSCRELGVDWVKRPTGGRALLHQHEITYSVASPVVGVFRGFAVRALYDLVSAVIRRTLTGLWVALDPAEPEAVRVREPALHVPCLALPGSHEITSGGRKTSRAPRDAAGRSQHGSILRRVDSGSGRGRPRGLWPASSGRVDS